MPIHRIVSTMVLAALLGACGSSSPAIGTTSVGTPAVDAGLSPGDGALDAQALLDGQTPPPPDADESDVPGVPFEDGGVPPESDSGELIGPDVEPGVDAMDGIDVAASADIPAPPIDVPVGIDGGPPPPTTTVAEAHQRADTALQSFLIRYWSGASGNLNSANPSVGASAQYWNFAQAFDAVLDGVERTGSAHYTGMIATLYNTQNAIGWTRNYYDDENWMALALIRAYDLTGDHTYLDEAETLYTDIMGAWDTTCCGAVPGGLWWDRAHTQKATASNAGAALTGARLYERTSNASYLSFARRAYDFWMANMVNPSTHQVADHMTNTGAVVWWRFTYNEGLMIGAGVELHAAAGVVQYLEDANAIASYMTAHETVSTPYGPALYDGSDASCGGDCAQFKGIGARYLAMLAGVETSNTSYTSVLSASADAIWNIARSASTGRISSDWAAPPPSTAIIAQDSSGTMALSVIASLAGPWPGPRPAAGTWQAEDGVLHHVGLEARYAGYNGWGYIAGWNQDGQWVDFSVPAGAAGAHTLTFRYSAGAGDASRYVFVNGHSVTGNLAMPATASWSGWATVSVSASLNVGANTVSLIYSSAMGSHGYVNLDELSVR